jgi:hypothetical protein
MPDMGCLDDRVGVIEFGTANTTNESAEAKMLPERRHLGTNVTALTYKSSKHEVISPFAPGCALPRM